jgi:hypothetical protein
MSWNKNLNFEKKDNIKSNSKKYLESNKEIIIKKEYTAKELIYWSSREIGDELLFDKILDIYDDIKLFLDNHNLKLKTDKELFLMKLLLFIYNRSNHKMRIQ